jgi:predicted 3-demethylubiquinone-9 3-methyltransferase (glyoxalase superfamily)
MPVQKITTFLMFNNQAEDAAKLYTSVFKNSKLGPIGRGPAGATSVNFVLDGQPFMAFNGGPHFKFSEGISLFVSCEDQQEVDHFWSKLLEGGGKEKQCGWLEDRFGISWQIVPKQMMELMGDPDPVKSSRVVQAMLKMVKLDVAALQKAYRGE